MKKKEKKTRTEADLLLHETKDRRLFPNVPDPSGKRSNTSRRNNHEGEPRPEYAEFAGQRYEVEVDVAVSIGRRVVRGKTENLSQTGMLLKMPAPVDITGFEGKNVTLDFRLHEGVFLLGDLQIDDIARHAVGHKRDDVIDAHQGFAFGSHTGDLYVLVYR